MIEARNVTKEYRTSERLVRVLDDASFRIESGQFIALVGRSGMGKTTVLNLVGGLDTPTRGEMLVDGLHLDGLDDAALSRFRNATVGFIFQSFFLRQKQTAIENTIVPLLFGGVAPKIARERAAVALEEVGLGALMNTPVLRLSGGQRQRVAIARAMVNDPRIILADEPTGNLDTQTSHDIFQLLHEHNTRRGTTIIIVTHDPLVEEYKLPLWTLDDGKVVEFQGSV